MNLKNKILLTLIAIIFAICLFNTNCFATTYDIYVPFCEQNISFELDDNYKYNLILTDQGDNKFAYCLVVSTTGVTVSENSDSNYYPIFVPNGDGHIIHGSSTTDVSYSNLQDRISSLVSNLEDKNLTEYKPFLKQNLVLNATFYTGNYTLIDTTDGSNKIVFEFPLERGTEDNTNPDSGETGNETTGTDSENTTDSDDSSGILSSITQGFKNVINFFTQLVDFVGNILSYLNPFSDNFILKGVIDFLGEILSYINPFSENFFVYKLIDLLGDLLEFLFIPNENSFTGIIDIVKSKFDFIDTIKTSANSLKDLISNVCTAPKLTINVNNNKYGVEQVTLIDLEWYKPYKTYGDLVLTGFIYAFFLWRLFISIPNILHGFGGSVQDSYKITEIKGGKD